MQQNKVSPEEIMQYCTNNFKIIRPVLKNDINELNTNLQGINLMTMEEDALAKTSLIFQQNQNTNNLAAQQKKIQYNNMISSSLAQGNLQNQQQQQNIMMQINGMQNQQQLNQSQTMNQNPFASSKLLKSFITPFEKHHLQELVEQTEIMIQLLIQNLLLASSENTQTQTKNLLKKIIERKDQVLARIAQDHKISSYNLPLELFNEDENNQKEHTINIVPQMSIFQSPLLNIMPQMKQLLKQKNQLNKEQIVQQLGSQLSPIINQLYLPIFSSNFGKNSSRSKFTPLDDNLLLQGLTKYGTSQNMDSIRSIFLQEKQTQEIKHRYKNLICSKAQANPIKQWKNLQYSPFSESEKQQFLKALKWFGKEHRFNGVSRYFFLGKRSGNLLEQEFHNKEKLIKKRKKHNYEVTNVQYSKLLEEFEMPNIQRYSSKIQNRLINKSDSNSFSDVIHELNNGDDKKKLSPDNQDLSFSSEKRQSESGNRYENQIKMNPQKKIKMEQSSQQMNPYDYNFQNSNQVNQINRSFNILNNSSYNNNINNQIVSNSNYNNNNLNESVPNPNNKYKNDFNKNNLNFDFQAYNSASDLSVKDRRLSPDQYQINNNFYNNNNNNKNNNYQQLNNSNNNVINKPSKFKMINSVTYEYDEI